MKIYNTLTRKKEDFIPLKEGEVSIYVCGPTVYNFFHIGNARPFVVFDTLRRYFEFTGYKVNFVQNFTDVDDKIIQKAKEEGKTASEIGEKYILEYFEDAKALNVREATVHPKVTDNIQQIIDFVKGLVAKGFAYEVEGDVYFDTSKAPEYGKLSRQNIAELSLGCRVEVGEEKRDPLDFSLWKRRKEEDEIAWDSPWGMGRPGWHIECSAMSKRYLGDTIDIHAGGQDLTFPHHENEIAQSEAENGVPFARYWMHNGYITIDNEKMSKSKGNFFTVRDIRKEYEGEVIRYFLLSAHYRSPINFSHELMEQAKSSLDRLRNAKQNLLYTMENGKEQITKTEEEKLQALSSFKSRFIKAMDDDLNTADGIAVIFEAVSVINNVLKDGASAEFAEKALKELSQLLEVLGLLEKDEETSLDDEVKKLLEEREEARKQKDYKKSDEIRDALKEKGITVKDTPTGVQIIKD